MYLHPNILSQIIKFLKEHQKVLSRLISKDWKDEASKQIKRCLFFKGHERVFPNAEITMNPEEYSSEVLKHCKSINVRNKDLQNLILRSSSARRYKLNFVQISDVSLLRNLEKLVLNHCKIENLDHLANIPELSIISCKYKGETFPVFNNELLVIDLRKHSSVLDVSLLTNVKELMIGREMRLSSHHLLKGIPKVSLIVGPRTLQKLPDLSNIHFLAVDFYPHLEIVCWDKFHNVSVLSLDKVKVPSGNLFPQLKELYLRNCHVSSVIPSYQHINKLVIEGSYNKTHLISELKSLKKLYIRHNSKIINLDFLCEMKIKYLQVVECLALEDISGIENLELKYAHLNGVNVKDFSPLRDARFVVLRKTNTVNVEGFNCEKIFIDQEIDISLLKKASEIRIEDKVIRRLIF